MNERSGKDRILFTSRVALATVAMAACMAAFAPSVPAAPVKTAAAKGDAHSGEAVFQLRCYQCHSVNEGEMRVGPSLYHELKKPKPKKTDAEVRLIIKNGKNKMPAWGAILTAEDTDNLLAYLHTL